MKKLIKVFIIVLASFILFMTKTYAKTANVYVFYGKTCPHCHEAMEYLDSIKNDYDFKTIEYEVWYDEENANLMKEVAEYLDVNARGVPFIVIDNTPIIGYSKGNTDQTYVYHIKKANKDKFVDKIGKKLGVVNGYKTNKSYEIKMLGKRIDLSQKSITLSTIILGIKDSINLSMLWSLVLIISILSILRNKKHIFYISFISVILSIVIYLTLLLMNKSFDNLLIIISNVRIILSILLISLGIYGLIRYINILDDKKVVIIPYKIKAYFGIILSLFTMIVSILIAISNQGGVPDTFINIIGYPNNYNVLLILLYFCIIFIINFIIYIVIYKIFDLLKLYDTKNKWSLVVISIIILIIAVFLGLNPNILLFDI